MTVNNSSLLQEITDHLKKLKPEEQQRVLEFTKRLDSSLPHGVTGESLLSFEGAISKNDLELMQQAIEQDCEKVSTDGW
ncbi:MAG TPA: hypothetical protein VII11_11440 [Bacteroidota bacterium]